jgi:hypothetical protein
MQVVAKAITNNQVLMNALKQELPQMAMKVQKQIQHHREQEHEF